MRATEKECSFGSFWSEEKLACTHPSRADCEMGEFIINIYYTGLDLVDVASVLYPQKELQNTTKIQSAFNNDVGQKFIQ